MPYCSCHFLLYFLNILSSLRHYILLLILFWSQLSATDTGDLLFTKIYSIITTNTLEKAENATEFLTPKSIVLIDVEDCIITPSSNFFHANSNERRLINQMEKQQSSFSPYAISLESFYLNATYRLVDQKWPKIINKYKEQTPYVFLLSSKVPGDFLSIKKMEQLVYNHLLQLNIIPNNLTINGQQYLQMNYTGVNDYNSIYYQGLILHGQISPNLVLGDLMYLNNLLPNKILYISTNKKPLKEVQILADKRKIDFQGIQYHGVYNQDGIPNPKLISLQKRILLEKQRWLEDQQLVELIKKQADKKQGTK